MTDSRKRLSSFALILLVAGQLLPQMDFSIVNVALDVMGTALHTDETGLVLIVAIYGLSFATLIATGARLGDRFGRKRLFMLGVIGFCVASAVCGLAGSLWPMLLGRFLQGVFGAILMPQILATIHATLSGEQHSRAVGIYTSVGGLSVVIGQMLGGWLVSADLFGLGWRVAFFINVPICLLVLVIGSFILPETRSARSPRMDIAGMLLFAVFLLCLLLPIALGGSWHALWWVLLGLLPAGWGLWRVERRKEAADQQPLLPPSLFSAPSVVIGFIGEATVTFCYPGYIFVTALSLQSVLHFTPLQSGNTFIAMGSMFFVGSLLSRRLNGRLPNASSFLLGAVLTLSGFLLTMILFWTLGASLRVWHMVPATGLYGLGNALMLTSAYRIALARVAKHHSGEASSVLNTVQQGCFALGTAVVGSIYAAMLGHGYQTAVTTAFSVLWVLMACVAVTIFRKGRRGELPDR